MRKRVDSFRSAWTGAAFLRVFCLAWLVLLPLGAARPIIVGSDRDFPPYEYVDAEGRPAGFLVPPRPNFLDHQEGVINGWNS
jgi:ABC-type amino acid transport substrate-binding protein